MEEINYTKGKGCPMSQRYCIKDDCSWYDVINHQCGVLSLAIALSVKKGV